jgi:chaperonin cofactor prefoldin
MKHLKHASETLEKHLKTLENSLQNIRNIQIKTLATYV